MSDSTNGEGRSKWRYLLALLPLVLGGFCCWSILRPTSPDRVLEAAERFETELLENIAPIDESDIEAYAVERRSGVIENGLLLTTIGANRSGSGISTFEAGLINLGIHPVRGAFVTLRLYDSDGQLVETIDLIGDEEILQPGRGQVVRGDFAVGAKQPRIAEETIAADNEDAFSFTIKSYDTSKESPSFLAEIAKVFPFLEYQAIWTKPDHDWESYQVQFRYNTMIKE